MASYDDEDDLTKWLQSQDAPNLTPQPSFQAPAAEGGTWSKARDLMDRQAQMQYQPQDYSRFLGKSEPAPDRTGHDFRTILAMALDLFGNKGRGAGQLMAAGNQTFDAKEAAWKRENGPQAMLARQMQVKQLEGADRAQFNQDRAVLGDQIGREMQMAGAQQTQDNANRTFEAGRSDHDDALAQEQARSLAQQQQFDAGQALSRDQMAQSKALQEAQMAQSARLSAAQMGQADRHFNLSQEQHRQDQANEMARAQAALQAQQLRQQQQDAQHALERGQDLSHQLSEETKDERRLLPSLAVVRANMDKYPENTLPGVGPLNSIEPNGFWGKAAQMINMPERDKTGSTKDFAADNLAMQKAIKDITEFDIRALSGANAPQAEVIREQLRMGGNNPQTVRQAITAFDDLLTKDFQSRASGGRQEAMRGLLAPYGREGVIGMPGEDDPLLGIKGLTKRKPLE